MLLQKKEKESLNSLFKSLRLMNCDGESGKDKSAKIEQILSYLEIIHSQVRGYSKKRNLVFVDSCAGKSYLSFLVYYYYTKVEGRPLTIHCVDTNEELMKNGKKLAEELGFSGLYFHTGDILDFKLNDKVEIVYSLHACDTATDKTLYLGIAHDAATILSVSCCQHSIKSGFRNSRYRGITKHSVFKERMMYMIGDSLRALLLEAEGYRTDIIQFTSSRNTDKNIMIRGRRMGSNKSIPSREEYEKIKSEFHVSPELEKYIRASVEFTPSE